MKLFPRAAALLLAIGLAGDGFCQEEMCDHCGVPPELAAEADALLVTEPTAEQAAGVPYLPHGIPAPAAAEETCERLLFQRTFVQSYDESRRIPIWVAYKLTAPDVASGVSRKNCFRTDPRVPGVAEATCSDYSEPVFDRGHLVPSADMKRTQTDQLNTFLFTNMAPQYPAFNQRLWEDLEGRVRGWATSRGEVYVISGSLFDEDNDGLQDSPSRALLMSSRVAIPTHFYKIVVAKQPDGRLDSIAVLLAHDNNPLYSDKSFRTTMLNAGLRSIAEIEHRAQVNFFPQMPDGPEKDALLNHVAATCDW